MLRLAGRKGWLVGGGSNQKGAKTCQGRICALSLVLGILGGSTWLFGAPCIVLAIPGFVSVGRGEEMGSGCEREPSGAVMVASAEMWYIRVGPRKKMVG